MFNNTMVLLLDKLEDRALGLKHCTLEYYTSKQNQATKVIQNSWPPTESLKGADVLNV